MAVDPHSEPTFRYDAFISYRHVELDRKWAKWLHRSLETYRTPKPLVQQGAPARIRRIFRDEEELAASSDLSEEINEALQQARFLIVVCSPETPASEWVNQEIVRFRDMGRDEKILSLLIDGEPDTAFPRALRELRKSITDDQGRTHSEIEEIEPLAADVRPTDDESPRSRKRIAFLRLAASLLGCRLDDLRQRERQRQQQRIRVVAAAATVLIAVLAGLTVFAFSQRNIAVQEAGLSFREQGRQAFMRDSPLKALVHLSNALQRIPEDTVTRFLITRAIPSAPLLLLKHPYQDWGQSNLNAAFSPDGMRVVTASSVDETFRIFDATTGEELFTIARLEGAGTYSPPVPAFSPDGTSLMASLGDNFIAVFDVATGELRRTLDGHTAVVTSIAFSSDGARFVSTSADRTARIWDAASLSPGVTLSGDQRFYSASFSPDGKTVMTVGYVTDDGVRAQIFDAATGNMLYVFNPDQQEIFSAIFSRDGKRVAATSRSVVHVFDVTAGNEGKRLLTLAKHDLDVVSMSFSPDSTRVATASLDGTARIWDAATGELQTTLDANKGAFGSVAFSPDGETVVTSNPTDSRIWDSTTGRTLTVLGGHEQQILSAAYSSDGTRVLTATGNAARIFDAAGVGALVTLQGQGGSIESTAFSPDGSRLVITDWESSRARIFDTATGNELAVIARPQCDVITAAFSPDSERVVTACGDDSATVVDAANGATLAVLERGKCSVNSATFSPDSKRVVTACNDETARVFDAATGVLQTTLDEPTDRLDSPSFSPDGMSLLTRAGTFDAWTGRKLAVPVPASTVFASEDGVLRTVLEGAANSIGSATFSPDGARVLMHGGHSLWVYSPGLDEILATLEGHKRNPNDMLMGRSSLLSAAFSSSGARVVTGGQDKLARVWDSATGEALAILEGHEDSVDSAVFSPDGKLVLTRSFRDKTAKIFDSETGKPLATLTLEPTAVVAAVFGPDGMRAATASEHMVRIWDVSLYAHSPDRLAEFVRLRVPYRMTDDGVIVPHSLVEKPK